MRNKKVFIPIILVIFLTTLVVYLVYSQSHKNDGLVARVDGVGITEEAFNKQLAQTVKFYYGSEQKPDEATVKKNVLDNLIEKQLILNYAYANNITVQQEKIDELYNTRVSAYKSEEALLKAIDDLYGSDKESFKVLLEYDLLRDEVQKSVGKPLADWVAEQKQTANIKIYITI